MEIAYATAAKQLGPDLGGKVSIRGRNLKSAIFFFASTETLLNEMLLYFAICGFWANGSKIRELNGIRKKSHS